ncbi:GNAT family protein [Micromonospora sp. M12]
MSRPQVVEGTGAAASLPLRGHRRRGRGLRGSADPAIRHEHAAPYTEIDARWWIDAGAPAVWTGGGAAYAIADPSPTGCSARWAELPVPARGQAEIGYWLRPAARGAGCRGGHPCAERARVRHRTARLELLTEPENGPSQRVALAAGFRYEGLRRSAGPSRDAGRHDLQAWVRVAGDPPGRTARLLPDLPGGCSPTRWWRCARSRRATRR